MLVTYREGASIPSRGRKVSRNIFLSLGIDLGMRSHFRCRFIDNTHLEPERRLLVCLPASVG